MSDPPTDFDRQPTSGAHPLPSAEVIALLPPWARAAVVIVPMLSALSGTIGGAFAGSQTAAIERAVLATKVESIQTQVGKLEGSIDGLERAFYSQRREP